MFGIKIIQEPHNGAWAVISTAWRVGKCGLYRGKPVLAWCGGSGEPGPQPLDY